MLKLPDSTSGAEPVRSSGAPKETEIKISIGDVKQAADLLASKGFAVVVPRVFERNTVFDTRDAALRASRCVLRIRTAGQCVLTFKGAPENGRHKCREEVETQISDAENAARILNHLGFHERFRYEKYRTELVRPGDAGIVTIDETPIGNFLEIEGDPQWIDATAAELGFTPAQYVTASYGSLYRKHCEDHGQKPSDMVFNATHRT